MILTISTGGSREFNIFASGYLRENLKERLSVRLGVCWDASIREDSPDFSLHAPTISQRLVSTVQERYWNEC